MLPSHILYFFSRALHGSSDPRQAKYLVHARPHSGDEKQTASVPPPFRSNPRHSDGVLDWGSDLTEIGPDDSISYGPVRSESTPRGKRHFANYRDNHKYVSTVDGEPRKSSGLPPSSATVVTESAKRKRTSLVLDGMAPPPSKRRVRILI